MFIATGGYKNGRAAGNLVQGGLEISKNIVEEGLWDSFSSKRGFRGFLGLTKGAHAPLPI